MQKFDVIINGAGLDGSSIGLALASAGLQVLIVEYAPIEKLYPKDDYGLRVSAFTPSSRKWLEHVGVWDQLLHSGRMTPFLHMYVWDGSGSGALQFDADGTGSDALGWILDNEATQGALIDRVKMHQNIVLMPLSTHSNSLSAKITLKSSAITPSRMLLSPMKSATKALAGSLYISSGVPFCCISPLFITTIVSDIVSASSWSCVTNIKVIPSSC